MALTTLMPLEQRLAIPENLYWAWLKYRRHLQYGDFWFDEAEVARFEANLKHELEAISDQFKKLRYRNSAIRPLPHPKQPEAEGQQSVRQAFWVPIRDQVAWIAFVNVVGPWLDYKMPPWSYGNRLYRSVWIEEKNDKPVVNIGWYRHTSGYLYRKFRQSWPLFRRHVFLTAKTMTGVLYPEELDEPERRVLEAEENFPDRHKLPYLKSGFWSRTRSSKLYWASIDLEKFYPSLSLSCILKNLSSFTDHFSDQIRILAEQLLHFPLYLNDWDDEELNPMGLSREQKKLSGIPTGLTIAGFLTNVGLLEVDYKVNEELNQFKAKYGRGVAHFRYVDDHVILSRRFEDLIKWIKRYEKILDECQTYVHFNYSKLKPKKLSEYLHPNKKENTNIDDLQRVTKEKCELDPKYPSPLITKTLWLVSNLARKEFDLLDSTERNHFLNELEHLLLADFPDEEIRKDTRISFAATMLSRLAPRQIEGSFAKLCQVERDLSETELQFEKLQIMSKVLKRNSEERYELSKRKNKIRKQIRFLMKKKQGIAKAQRKENNRNHRRIFYLLLKAISEHPEKPRLWVRLLQFCQYSGYQKLDRINKELRLLYTRAPLTTPYLFAFVQQLMGRQAVQCAVDITRAELPIYRREAALSYLKALVSSPIDCSENTQQRYFETASKDLFRCGMGTALTIIKHSPKNVFIQQKDLEEIESLVKNSKAIDWVGSPEDWASKTSFPLSVWAWWAETKSTLRLGIEPGPIWQAVAGKLKSNDPCTWALWARYPRYLFEMVGPKPFQEVYPANKPYFERLNGGWLYEVFSSANDSFDPKYLKKNSRNRIKSLMILPKDRMKRSTSLSKWVEWTSDMYQKDPFDPRISEWTALEIIDQIGRELLSSDLLALKNYFPIHPANFFFPKNWIAERKTILTWEEWKTLIRDHRDKITIWKKNLIHDFRYTPMWKSYPDPDKEWAPARGLALLLLGLVTRSFDWPASWNTIGHARANASLIRSRMREAPFSSWSASIIEACLLPRPRETYILQTSLQEELSDDTTLDPPKIYNMKSFLACINKAKNVLESYQITVQKHMPRQLIPVKMQQLTRPNWVEDFGEDVFQ